MEKDVINIVIATKNQGKLEGASAALNDFLSCNGKELGSLITSEVESGVADTPLSDEEGLTGCENRLKTIHSEYPGSDLYIALEGVLSLVKDDWFVRGWTMIDDATSNRRSTASGAAVQVPTFLTQFIDDTEQFSVRVSDVYGVNDTEKDSVRTLGANGVFSNGRYMRKNSFYDGISICLAQLANDRNLGL